MKIKVITICAAALLASSGAFVAHAQDTTTAAAQTAQSSPASPPAADAAPAQQAAAAPEASAASDTPELPSAIEPPPEGKGQIVFFRPSRFVGAALSFTVRENDVALGPSQNGRYFVHVADPGIHSYEVGRNDTMRMEIEAGQTYWVREDTAMGILMGRGVLTPSDQAAFEQALPHMSLAPPPQPAAH